MSKEPLHKTVAAAACSDVLWARLQQRYGPERLRGACHEVIGSLVDEYRVVLDSLPAAALQVAVWQMRAVRAPVEVRLAALEAELGVVPARVPNTGPPVQMTAAPDWPVWLHRFMDAAGSGLTMAETIRQYRTSRAVVQAVFAEAGVPLPWQVGGRRRAGMRSAAFVRAQEVMAQRFRGVPMVASPSGVRG